MDTKRIKTYAPQARRDFIAAVTDRAAIFGITKKEIAPVTQQGDVAIIAGQAYPKEVANLRALLADRIRRDSFEPVMEAMAYTWFNRLVAIRFMELHGYLEHGYRVLSHPEGKAVPEILEHATEVDLPGVDRSTVVDLKIDGTRDEELYRLLLTAQCHALHQAMPFLFESLDETELLLPDRLLHTDSLVRRLVEGIEESAWESIEIIGWLYQFYISEKKDQVIGKVVKSEDIPAATQLFTPNWIVKYMVQNSLGAQWLATYPDSALKARMEFYIEPAEQTEEVKAQLAAITPKSLNPEEITLIDPACGSGHILVEAYDLFKAIYLERGYRPRDVPRLILEKNLFGLDIDERAAQLTGFALMMKGRADDRRLFTRSVELNVQAFQDSTNFDPEILGEEWWLADYGLGKFDFAAIKSLFQYAKTFGALIEVPTSLAAKLPALQRLSEMTNQDMFVADAFKHLRQLVRQAEMIAVRYDVVVANPPYMGSKFYCPAVKKFVNTAYEAGKGDLYGAFTLRNIMLAKDSGHIGMITIPNWMFLSSFEQLRSVVFQDAPISSLVHNGRGVWGSDFGSCSYVLRRSCPNGLIGRFLRLFEKQGSVASNEELERRFHNTSCFSISNAEFKKIPGAPLSYWLSSRLRNIFEECAPFSDFAVLKQGLSTTDSDRFVRRWFELPLGRIDFNRKPGTLPRGEADWYPFNKGGGYRNWYGNGEYVVNYEDDGQVLIDLVTKKYPRISDPEFVIKNRKHYFKQAITYTSVSSSYFGVRFLPQGFIMSVAGPVALISPDMVHTFLAFLCSKLAATFMGAINPTLGFQGTDVGKLPIAIEAIRRHGSEINWIASQLIEEARYDWDSFETSWGFQAHPILTASSEPILTLESSYATWASQNRETVAKMKHLEEENNRLFIYAYGLADELTLDVSIEQVTLTVNPAYRYGGKLTKKEQWIRFLQDSMQELISYAIGCMMGRFSLDEPGFIYAHSGNKGFDPSRYSTLPADDDGIIPLTDLAWFDDDATHRLEEFLSVAWDKAHLEENVAFLAENLSPKRGESSRDTLRRYLATRFFKDHLQTYKKRPIYWLFSSGKQRAFQCLVYLHRYHEGTLGRMRTEYVIPLQGKMVSRIQQLEGDVAGATSTSHRKKLEKERDTLLQQRVELQEFDEKLRHYADQRIHLDLDDGVKVNYGKFGDLLAEVKTVTGKKPA